MTIMHPQLLAEIDDFLSQTGMGESYFGKVSVGNSELVARLRDGKRVWPETETRIKSFIVDRLNANTPKRKQTVSSLASMEYPHKAGSSI